MLIYIYIFKDNIDKKTWGMGTEGEENKTYNTITYKRV